MPQAISFDFWNTLYADGAEDQRRVLRKAYFSKIISNYGEYSEDQVEQAFKSSSKLFFEKWLYDSRTPTTIERIKHMASFLEIQMKPDHTEELADFFARVIFEIPPKEIAYLKSILPRICAKYPLGIISDTGYISGEYIRKFLEQENILNYFTSLYFSDEHPHSKPHKSVFKYTATNLGVALKHLMHIGDLERTDIAGAISAGCQAIKFTGVHTDQPENGKAHFVISDYAQLPEVLSF